ncbi:MAG: hypothetical protein OCD02_11190 [Spirochaetaceae bacterium]
MTIPEKVMLTLSKNNFLNSHIHYLKWINRIRNNVISETSLNNKKINQSISPKCFTTLEVYNLIDINKFKEMLEVLSELITNNIGTDLYRDYDDEIENIIYKIQNNSGRTFFTLYGFELLLKETTDYLDSVSLKLEVLDNSKIFLYFTFIPSDYFKYLIFQYSAPLINNEVEIITPKNKNISLFKRKLRTIPGENIKRDKIERLNYKLYAEIESFITSNFLGVLAKTHYNRPILEEYSFVDIKNDYSRINNIHIDRRGDDYLSIFHTSSYPMLDKWFKEDYSKYLFRFGDKEGKILRLFTSDDLNANQKDILRLELYQNIIDINSNGIYQIENELFQIDENKRRERKRLFKINNEVLKISSDLDYFFNNWSKDKEWSCKNGIFLNELEYNLLDYNLLSEKVGLYKERITVLIDKKLNQIKKLANKDSVILNNRINEQYQKINIKIQYAVIGLTLVVTLLTIAQFPKFINLNLKNSNEINFEQQKKAIEISDM